LSSLVVVAVLEEHANMLVLALGVLILDVAKKVVRADDNIDKPLIS